MKHGQGIVEYAVILVMVAVIAVVLIAAIGAILSLKPPVPSAFNSDVLTVINSCGGSNAHASTVIINNVPITNRSFNADGFLNCMYASGLTLMQNGDPVVMRTVQP